MKYEISNVIADMIVAPNGVIEYQCQDCQRSEIVKAQIKNISLGLHNMVKIITDKLNIHRKVKNGYGDYKK